MNTISRKIDVSNENLKDINKSTESIDSKMTTSNNRLSEISSDTARINDSLNAISDLLTSIKNNTAAGSGSGGNGTGNGDGSGTSLNRCKETDFTDDNLSDLFAPGECRGEYHKALNDINKKMDDQAEFDKKYMEWLQSDGKVKSDNDSVFKEQDAGALSNMLDGSLFGSSNAQCPAPWVVQTKLGSITLTFKYICQFAVQIHFVFIFIGTFFGIREFLSYGVTGK
ncbi:hypothetical protein CDG60_06170 [Acinetobacter chinensis]|uniref:Uncharacterized protein n=1 Tax=Acinetobacter chinensis TaxID=2004650 RepID=A0A3B7LW39_9GAMM|nr:hypothetical protein CDG60_06170 [Acinetobacter chinensis]